MTLLSSKVKNLFRKYPEEFMREYRGCSDLDCIPGCNISNAHCERIAIAFAEWQSSSQLEAAGKSLIAMRNELDRTRAERDLSNAQVREALEIAKNIIFGAKHLADRERNYAKSAEHQSYIDTLEAALALASDR